MSARISLAAARRDPALNTWAVPDNAAREGMDAIAAAGGGRAYHASTPESFAAALDAAMRSILGP